MPEVKETERKCRGLLEASDTQVDGTGTKVGRKVWGPAQSPFLYISGHSFEALVYKELAL